MNKNMNNMKSKAPDNKLTNPKLVMRVLYNLTRKTTLPSLFLQFFYNT